jgi:endoglucanase
MPGQDQPQEAAGVAPQPMPKGSEKPQDAEMEVPTFRGTTLTCMEMAYFNYNQDIGPIPGQDYPVYDTRLIDYFVSKRMTAFRFLFSWEGMEPHLGDTIPYADNGNYQAYFDNYKRIVDYATNVQGAPVIIEPWQAEPGVRGDKAKVGGARWRGDLVGTVQVPTAAFADFWAKMVANFKDNLLVSYGLVNEPNSMSTMSWWASAQAAITAIRNAGSTQRIFVQGNGYTAASGWTRDYYDTDPTPHSNAYGWLNTNGPGAPIVDPANTVVAEVHTYLDATEGGLADDITSVTAVRDHIAVALDEATAQGYKIYLGELGIYAGNPDASAAWADFIAYFEANAGPIVGFTWWGASMPQWWHDLHAPYFAISPINEDNFTGDTVNMQMIQNDF